MSREDKKHHYLYMVKDEVTNEFYIGKRSTNTEPDKDKYFGSGIWIKEHGTNGLTKIIISQHSFKEFAREEIVLIDKHRDDDFCRNRIVGKFDFTKYGKMMYEKEKPIIKMTQEKFDFVKQMLVDFGRTPDENTTWKELIGKGLQEKYNIPIEHIEIILSDVT